MKNDSKFANKIINFLLENSILNQRVGVCVGGQSKWSNQFMISLPYLCYSINEHSENILAD